MEGNIQDISKEVVVRDILAMHLKKSFMKGCHIFTTYMEEVAKYRVASIEEVLVLRDFEDFLGEILRLPPKRDIDFSIDLL